MRKLPIALTIAAALSASACGGDASRVSAPDAPLRSEWTRTYYVAGRTYEGTKPFNMVPAPYAGGYVKVESVPDNPAMGAYELGIVQADWDEAAFFKEAYTSIRLTAIPTLPNCSFRGWIFGTSSSISTSINPINMDNYRPQSRARAEFLCTP